MSRSKTQLLFEEKSDPDNTIMFVEMGGGEIHVSVADEVAVDSYNSQFELSFDLSRAEASILRDWLVSVLKDDK